MFSRLSAAVVAVVVASSTTPLLRCFSAVVATFEFSAAFEVKALFCGSFKRQFAVEEEIDDEEDAEEELEDETLLFKCIADVDDFFDEALLLLEVLLLPG